MQGAICPNPLSYSPLSGDKSSQLRVVVIMVPELRTIGAGYYIFAQNPASRVLCGVHGVDRHQFNKIQKNDEGEDYYEERNNDRFGYTQK